VAEGGAAITVAVADVENATGEKDLDGLSGLLITSLEQSKKLSVLTRSRMLDMLQRAGQDRVEHVDERLGREVSRRAGARALLLASIRRFDQVYALELKAIDPIADEYLFTVKEQGTGKASIPGLIDRVAEAGRRALREQAAEVSASRVQVASLTGSLEAYQHYFVGVQCIDGLGPVADCVEHFRRALAIDPAFALAHYMVAYTSEFRRAAPGEQKAAIEAALQHIDRTPPKERGLILAWKAHLDGKDDEASGIYKGLVERYPQDGHVAYTAGDLLFHKDDVAGALPYFEKADALGAAIPVMRHHIVAALFKLRRPAEGLERARAWVAAQPDAVNQHILATALYLNGDFSGAVEGARKAIDKGGGWESQALLVDALSMQGKIAEAEELARRLAGPDQPIAGRQAARVQLANLLAYQGRRREGLALLDAYRADGEGPHKGSPYRAVWLLGGGREQLAQARREVEQLDDPRAAKGAVAVVAALVLRGEREAAEALARDRHLEQEEVVRVVLDWQRGDRDGAMARLRALEAREPGHAYLFGELHAAAGRDREAVEELRRFRTLPMEGALRGWAYPRSLYVAARSLERMGDRAGARAEIEQLLQLWRRADPDQPLLAEARALRGRLGDG
jgi:tetratricopeptide (TPR) repeat protein